MSWFRRRGLLLRAFVLCTGLVTVWCLGCRAFEPLLSCLDSMEIDDADETEPRLTMPDGSASDIVTSANETTTPDHDCLCGCASCYGSLAPVADIVIISASAGVVFSTRPISPPAIARPPLVPPPQVTV
jgi:hypothetical protein